MTTPDLLRAALEGGGCLLFQRVHRSIAADETARAVGGTVVTTPFGHTARHPVVLDARHAADTIFDSWDARRDELLEPPPKVVLVDVRSARLAVRRAPHTVSAAGGIQLPVEPVRLARSADEIALGRRLLAQALAERPVSGCLAGVDLLTERMFARPDQDPRHLAQEALDEAVLYVEYVP